MKHITTFRHLPLIALAGTLAIAGCSESEPKDEAYYQKNLGAAEQKLKDCEAQMMSAFQSNDKEKAKKLAKDTECNAASKAIKADKRAKRKAEQAAREAKIQAQRKTALDAAEKQFSAEHPNIDWKGIMTVKAEQKCGYISKNQELNETDAMCLVIKNKYTELVDPVKTKFANLPFPELLAKEITLCKLNRGRGTPCSVWLESLNASAQKTFADTPLTDLIPQKDTYCKSDSPSKYNICNAYNKVVHAKEKALVEEYAKNDEKFTSTYKMCYDKVQKMKAAGVFMPSVKVREEDFNCEAVNNATYNRNLTQYSNFAKPLE